MRRLAHYVHELPDWPRLRWKGEALAAPLAAVRHRQGRLIGHMEALGFKLQQEAVLKTLTEDVLKSSEIEGEKLDAEQVRCSIARRLGMDIGALKPADRYVEGIVEMMLDANRYYDQPLTVERLFAWHGALFSTGRSGMNRIRMSAWRNDRTGPMQVVSGPPGRERVHYQAPMAGRLDGEMQLFLDWFNRPPETDEVLKAGLCHLWFVTIHPFDDGNGRMARAIADMALARSEKAPSGSTAYRHRSARNVKRTTTSLNRLRKDPWMSHRGWLGLSAASVAPSTAPRQSSGPSLRRHASGSPPQARRSTTASALSSTGC